ncbi:hypothetical protein KR067_005556 [Drosophila pandora]|nr:hypothetical protein KR067_005556 [Drosophila pandora]
MFSRFVTSSLIWRRSFSVSTVRQRDACYKAFEEKVREYRLKSPDGKPVDPTPEYYKELEEAICKLGENYGGGEGVDLLEFPKFQIPDLDIDPISVLELPENKPKKDKEGNEVEAKDAKGKKDKDEKDKKAKAGGKDDKKDKDKKEKPKTDDKKK